MKHILLFISILTLSACGGGSGNKNSEIEESVDEEKIFNLQNIRFDSKDYYEGEQITVIEGTRFEVQWVSPTAASYKIDLYLSTSGKEYSDSNKIVGLKCGNTSFSLCPNATGEVQCGIADNELSCSIEDDFLGSKRFQDKDLSNLTFIIKGCDALNNCDVKAFDFLVESNTDA